MNERAIREVLKNIIAGYLNKQLTKEHVITNLIHSVDCEVIYGSDNFLITDSYFTLKHISEENISNEELEYLLDCLDERREYKLEEKPRPQTIIVYN